MLGLSCALAAVLAAPGGLADGTWLPTRGGAGERPIAALAGGGDGALYAAGAGQVWRLVPGDRWRSVGVYGPRLGYDGERVTASGRNFDVKVLEDVAEEATVFVSDRLDDAEEDTVVELLQEFISERDADQDSPYRLAGIVPSTAGVWLGTGAGVFWADAKGVTGPIGTVTQVVSLAATPRGLAVIGAGGLYAVAPNGRATTLASFVVERGDRVATVGDRVALLAAGQLSFFDADGRRTPAKPPEGQATHIAGDGDTLWAHTPLALFRWQGDAWHLCGASPGQAERLLAAGGRVVMVGEYALTATDRDCTQSTRILPPWPGGLVMTDAAVFAGSLWTASTEGVFLYAEGVKDGQEVLRVEKLRRDMNRLPSLEELLRAIFAEQRIDRVSTSPGSRPLIRTFLPTLVAHAWTRPERIEDDITLTAGGDQLTLREPAFEWRVALAWTIRFDGLIALFADSPDLDETDLDDNSDLLLDDLVASDVEVSDTLLVEDFIVEDFGGVGIFAFEIEEDAEVQAARANAALKEQRMLEKARGDLRKRVATLYRQRLRLMRQLSQADAGAALDIILEMDQIDAELDALSGGLLARQMRGSDPGKEAP